MDHAVCILATVTTIMSAELQASEQLWANQQWRTPSPSKESTLDPSDTYDLYIKIGTTDTLTTKNSFNEDAEKFKELYHKAISIYAKTNPVMTKDMYCALLKKLVNEPYSTASKDFRIHRLVARKKEIAIVPPHSFKKIMDEFY